MLIRSLMSSLHFRGELDLDSLPEEQSSIDVLKSVIEQVGKHEEEG